MRRSLPFIIIALVALLTVGIATTVYRVKVRPAPVTAVAATPTPADEKEDPSLHVRGPREAPVTLEIYGDFQCPSCAVASQAIDDLQKQYAGKLRIVFHEFPLAMHNHAVDAARAAEAAGLQGHFWEMHDMLYQYQPIWSKATNPAYFFGAYANSLGLDVERFRADLQSPEVQTRVISDADAGAARGVKNTPTLYINGREVKTLFTFEKLQALIEEALAAKKNS
jgi:protein-disulfide isomerase